MCLFNENNGNKIIYNIFILFYYSESKINTYIHLYIYIHVLFFKSFLLKVDITCILVNKTYFIIFYILIHTYAS